MVEDPAGGPHTTLSSGAKIIGGAYEVERLIKAGGMGEVYRGRNVQTGRNVAIKIILASLARDEKYMALFEREALILEELSHEAIVRYQLYAVDQTTGRPCLVMQFVPGPSLKERMEQGPMPGDEIRTLARRLAAGLQAAHNHEYRVYHRDLSPDNVILEDGKVEKAKLIDFGIAKGGAQSNEKSMLAGQIAGKFSYMAPEQLGLFGDDIDARTDIYSLGLILLGLFRGKAVDMGKNVGEAVMRRQSVPDLSAAAPEMQPLLERMLAPQPEHRPANMGEVLQMLDQARPARPRPLSEASETTVVMPKIARPAPEAAPPVAAPVATPVPPPVAAPVAPVAPPPVAPSPAAVVASPPAAPAENLDATVIKPLPPSAPAAAPAPLPPVETRRPPEVVKAEAAKPAPKAEPVKPEPAKAEAPAKAPPSKPEAPKSEGGKSAGQKSDGQKSDAAAELDALFDVSRPASPSAAAASGSGPSIMGTAAQAAKAAPAPVQKKSALPMILAGVAVLALGGGGAYVFLGSSSSPTPAAVETAAKTPEPAVEAPKTAAAEPEKAPEPKPEPEAKPEAKPEPKPDPALQRAGLQDQLAALSADLSGSCRFLRLAPETAGAAPLVLALAPTAQSASEALARLTLPGEAAAAPQAKSLTLPDTPAFCGAVELANLAHVPGPLGLQVTGLTQGKAKAGQSLTGTLTGADANTRLYLIGGATGRVTPLALEGGRFALTLDLAAPGRAQELLLAIAPDGALPSLAEIQDGQAADSVIRHIAHGLKTEGRKASFDLLPFTLEK